MDQPTVVVPVRLPRSKARILDSLAKRRKTTRAGLIREAVDLLIREIKEGRS